MLPSMTESTNPPPAAARRAQLARKQLGPTGPQRPAPQPYQGNPQLRALTDLPPGTEVRFFLHGRVRKGVTADLAIYNSNRKPGLGRVTYEVYEHPAAWPVRVPATNIISHHPPAKEPQ